MKEAERVSGTCAALMAGWGQILFAERLAAAETQLFSISVSLPVGTNAIEGAL